MRTLEEVSALVGALPLTDRPLALFPVQVQARFVVRDDREQLLVRVYPDDLHVDGHEEELTAAEVEWGRRYWEQIWPAKRDTETQRAAWDQLSGRFGPRRAAWVARVLAPTNLGERPTAGNDPVALFPDPGAPKDDTWTRPARARLLPDRWVVAGFVSGERVLLEVGAPVPDELAVSVDPDDESEAVEGAGEEALAIDEGMRWMVDFEEAERVGMGIRVILPPELIGTALDRLLVFGVCSSLGVGKSQALLEAQLDAHHYTRGLAFVPPGTPTNNAATVPSGMDSRGGDAFAVEVTPPHLDGDTDGAHVADALGIRWKTLTTVEGADRKADLDARHMQTALWPVTGGYYLDQILAQPAGTAPAFSAEDIEEARRIFVDFVRPVGPLPTLRVGRQPYGLLPVQSLSLVAASSAAKSRFVRGLSRLEPAWQAAGERAPRLRPGNSDTSQLVDILRMQPMSTGYHARLIFDSQFFAPSGVSTEPLDPLLAHHADLLRRRLSQLSVNDLVGDGRVIDLLPTETAVPLGAPLVQRDAVPPGSPPSPNYITFLRTATFDDVLEDRLLAPDGTAALVDALLYLLLRHSVLLAYVHVASRILVRRGLMSAQPFLEPALVDIAGGSRPAHTRTLLRILELDPELRPSLHTLTAADEPEAAALDDMRAALAHLETLPVDTLAREMCGCLDLYAYRLDAWITSLATRRLSELRAVRERGLAMGGYGWLEDLEPASRVPVPTVPAGEEGGPLFIASEPGGFIHAPSLGQASAAALLRSGYLTQPGEGSARPFAVDLSSERVRLARWLVDGVREGQRLGDLLGYRFERGLHDGHLDRFIDGFRRVAVLGTVYLAEERLQDAQALPTSVMSLKAVNAARVALEQETSRVRQRFQFPDGATLGALERIVSASVADGLALSRMFEAGSLPFDRVDPNLDATQRALLEGELRRLADAVDALGDALTAEGVYQLALGNPARAAASVDAIAHGEIQPPELTFAATPRSGTAVTHRLVTLFAGEAPAAPELPRAHRAAAEPRLDAWLARMLGDLSDVRARATFVDAEGNVLGEARAFGLDATGVSHLDVIHLTGASRPGQPSELERLIDYRLRRSSADDLPADAVLRVDWERGGDLGPDQLGLAEFVEVVGAFRRVALSARALRGRDFLQGEAEPADALDVDELRARADAAVEKLRTSGDALVSARDACASADADALGAALEALRERLLDVHALGVEDALPLSARGSGPDDVERLTAQAASVAKEVGERLAAVDASEDAFDRGAADAETAVEHDQDRLRGVFGRAFVALPLVRPANAGELASSLEASDALQGGDPLQAPSWLQATGRVRPAASRLDGALAYAAALERPGAQELRVAQLPFVAGERWVALPAEAGSAVPSGRTSIVAHLPSTFDAVAPFAGLVVDEWVEVIPADEVTSGVSFQYDAPGARPPQAILLAVAPPDATRWDLASLERTLHDTLDLAHLRALDPHALSQDVLLQRLFPALYVSLDLGGNTISTDFARARK